MTRLLRIALLCAPVLCAPLAHAQWDVNASLYGQFSGSTSSNGVSETPENSAGVLVGLRRYERPWRGYEVTYSFNHANYDFSGTTLQSVTENAHSVTADYIVSLPFPGVGIRPFLLGGGGVVLLGTDTKGVFSYGGGLDWRLVPHIGLRVQYRGLLYTAPEFSNAFSSTGNFTRTSEPVAGLYFKF